MLWHRLPAREVRWRRAGVACVAGTMHRASISLTTVPIGPSMVRIDSGLQRPALHRGGCALAAAAGRAGGPASRGPAPVLCVGRKVVRVGAATRAAGAPVRSAGSAFNQIRTWSDFSRLPVWAGNNLLHNSLLLHMGRFDMHAC